MDVFGTAEIALISAIVDRIIPADQDIGGIESGAANYVVRWLQNQDDQIKQSTLVGLKNLRVAAEAAQDARFELPNNPLQDSVLRHFEKQAWFLRIAELATEGFYADEGNGGNIGEKSWSMIGYEPRLQDAHAPRYIFKKYVDEQPAGELYDVIVVGAGAGGGIVACVLAEAGKRVLLLERGDDYHYEISGKRDHLRNHRLSQYGHNTGPDIDGNPRVFVAASGNRQILKPHERGYHSNAAGAGSATVVYGGQAWRFHPDDFRMASRYGVPTDSSLVDWPISYDELAPFYARAEKEIGVAGSDGWHPGTSSVNYPMPPGPGYAAHDVLAQGARKLGMTTFAPPLLINTVSRQGRAACIQCGSCVGFACPSDAKNGTQNTVIPRALATGRCTLLLKATAERIETDASGKVIGVSYRRGLDGEALRHSVQSRCVVLAGGAIETARLLLLSACDKHANGLGNNHDQVGRNLQGHVYSTAFGLFDDYVYDPRGPGVTIASCDFNHGNPGIIGGGMLADDFIMLPVIFWRDALPPDVPRWGSCAKSFMRDNYRRVMAVRGPVQEIPTEQARVCLDSEVKDRFGLAVAKMSGTTHAETIKSATYMLGKAASWLNAAGARRIWSEPPKSRLSGGQHQAGTCRMGKDPRKSVTDSHGRVWGFDNLFVADASLHSTNGGFNPVLTVMALAFRTAEQIAKEL